MVDLAIQATGLTRAFGRVRAVERLDLGVPRGSVYGFLGPNGSGKTTTIRLILGLLRPDAGSIRLLGEPLSRTPDLLGRVGALVERPAFYPGLSARDNLRVFALTAGLPGDQVAGRIQETLASVGLADVGGRHVRSFSTGMRQRLAIGLALVRRPDLVILDEPTAGLDPAGVADVRDVITALGRRGTTVFLSSHVLPEVEQVCDRLAILDRGRLIAEGPTTELLGRDTRLAIRFDTREEADRACAVVSAAGRAVALEPGGLSLLVAGDGSSSEVARLLAAAGLFPAEMTIRRPTLESVFLALTDDARAAGSRR
jgi:ABC-type multidrug transport system ATPase subunit